MIGRLVPSADAAAAAAELLAIFKQEGREQFSQSLLDRLELTATPLQQRLVGDLRQRLLLVMGAVAFVLLVACANVANLLMARASTRQRELAVRNALGARRGRLARLLLTESVLLAMIGAGGALLLTWATGGVARTFVAYRIPLAHAMAIDWWVLGFNVTVATLTGVVCGLAALPAATRLNLASTFGTSGPAPVTGRTTVRRALLSVEVAATFVLVVGAALLAQTVWNLTSKERGFDADRLLTMRVAAGVRIAGQHDVATGQAAVAVYFSDLTRRVARLPGIASAAAVSSVPLAGLGMGSSVQVDGQPALEPDASFVPLAAVTPGYFGTMVITIAAGRDFDEGDRDGSTTVAVVNEAFRRRFTPNRSIVGSRVTFGETLLTVVGLVADVPEQSLRVAAGPVLFVPLRQTAGRPFFWPQLTIVVRAAARDPRALVPALHREIWAANPHIVVDQEATMDERIAASIRSERQSAVLFGLFAVVAVAIALVGVYGVAAYAMASRTKEIGIRLALGAARRDVARLVVSHALWPTLAGIVAGMAGAVTATRVVASMLYGVTPLDPVTFAGAALVLVGVALAATYVPARRAAGIDPIMSLRYD
jgi:predicted permease